LLAAAHGPAGAREGFRSAWPADTAAPRDVAGDAAATLLELYRPLFESPADGAVIVGAGTVAADDPQLTTREVPGPNPLRVVLDPRRRLAAQRRLFVDRAAPTLLVHSAQVDASAPPGIETLALGSGAAGLDLPALVAALQARGCRRLFVEGGARTVAGFVQAGLLSRLQIAVAPLLIGAGRPTIRLPGSTSLSDCLRARHRVFRMGSDVLFDLDLAQRRDGGTPCVDARGLQQVV
jgi:riboflavin-specific deaminase-like protein